MDERTRTLPVVVEIDSDPKTASEKSPFSLRPGMFVTIRIKGKSMHRVFQVPRHLIHDGNQLYLFQNNRLHMRQVRILRHYRDFVIIGSGLSDGEHIIKTPLTAASDGMLIRLQKDSQSS